MGNNYRFRFSDMLPNAWFYKLRDMTKNTHTNNPNRKKTANKKLLQSPPPNNNRSSQITKIPLPSPPAAAQRKSYHIQRETEAADVITPPRKSSRIRTRRRNRQTHPPPPRLSAGCSCRATLESVVCDEHGSPDDEPDGTIDFDLRPDLPPIITTTTKKKENLSSANFSSSPGVRLGRTKVASRRMVQGRKSASTRRTESLAVVKTSKDPGRDFRESMVEMIAENNIRAAEDLEELLACYLSLNSDEYHQLIVDVFTQIWFDAHR